MKKGLLIAAVLAVILLLRCTTTTDQVDYTLDIDMQGTESFVLAVKNLTDEAYPDNPNIGFRSINHRTDLFVDGRLDLVSSPFHWDFLFLTKESDTILLSDIDISELVPTIPDYIKPDESLSYISCINQEWNRNQVRFEEGEFHTTIPNNVRVDLARNCLNAYLWEIILYVEEGGEVKPYAHGWFDFPHEMYRQVFEAKNRVPFAKYAKSMEDWVTAEEMSIDLGLLRKVVDTVSVSYGDYSDAMYPLQAARKKKFKEIISPVSFTTMRDLQTDATTFATFTPPGFYNKSDPRKTELGRIQNLRKVSLYQIESLATHVPLYELQVTFSHADSEEETNLVIGGLNLDDFPVLTESEANQAWKSSMGIGNHTFYEAYQKHLSTKSEQSPYYALLLDGDNKWLDSHEVGIDGPMFHFSDKSRTKLHLWLLSFERHALVGHYEIVLD